MGDALSPIDSASTARRARRRGRRSLRVRNPRHARGEMLGMNPRGQLGVGGTRPRVASPGTMGDALPVVALW